MKYNFIIPYRNRKEHLDEFVKRFSEFMKKNPDVDMEFFIIHQINSNEFNRGALKNIGFLEVCKKYPDGLFIFHDIDTYPTYWGSIDYQTKRNTVRHPIGFKNENLGGICCFWKDDFEKVNGFPNYWGWGIEDVTLFYRVSKLNIVIDDTNIVPLNDNSRCYLPEHHKNKDKEDMELNRNLLLHKKEIETGDFSNGLSTLNYNIISYFELSPKFNVINVDFICKDN